MSAEIRSASERCIRQRRAFRRAHVDFKLRLVVNRQEVFSDEHKQGNNTDDHEQASDNYYPAMCHRPAEHSRVRTIDWRIKPRLLRAVVCRFRMALKLSFFSIVAALNQTRCQHRSEREGNQQRNCDGER